MSVRFPGSGFDVLVLAGFQHIAILLHLVVFIFQSWFIAHATYTQALHNEKLQQLYNYTHFNPIQTQVLPPHPHCMPY